MNRALAAITVALGSVASLAAVSTPAIAAPHPAVVDDAQIELAKLGITLFTLDYLAAPVTDCPAVRLDEAGYWMGQLGMAGTTQGYGVEPFSPEGIEALAVFCGVNPNDFIDAPDPAAPFALGIEVYNLLEGATFQQLLTTMSSPVTPTPTPDPALGGEVATWCGSPGQTVCLSFWHRNGLVLDVLIVGPASGLDEAKAQQLLLSMVDNAVTNLAAYNSSASTASTLPTPTVAPVPTQPVVTVAPVPTVPTPTVPTPTAAPVPTQPVPTAPVPTAPVPTVATPTVAPVPTAAPVPTVPVPTVATPTVPVVTGPTVPGVPTTLPVGFVRVTDDSGTISFAVPSTWTDVQTAGLLLDDGTTTPQLIASTNVTSFVDTFESPGVKVVTAAPFPDPQGVLTSTGLTGGCTFTTEPYNDGVYIGFAQIGTACGNGTAGWKMIVGNTVDGATGVIIQLQTASPADQLAVDTALSTLVVS